MLTQFLECCNKSMESLLAWPYVSNAVTSTDRQNSQYPSDDWGAGGGWRCKTETIKSDVSLVFG